MLQVLEVVSEVEEVVSEVVVGAATVLPQEGMVAARAVAARVAAAMPL